MSRFVFFRLDSVFFPTRRCDRLYSCVFLVPVDAAWVDLRESLFSSSSSFFFFVRNLTSNTVTEHSYLNGNKDCAL